MANRIPIEGQDPSKARSAKGEAPKQPQQPSAPIGMFMLFFLFLFILLDPGMRGLLGTYAGAVLTPAIGFDSGFPIWSLFVAGMILVIFSTVVRHFTTDWIGQGKLTAYQKALNEEMKRMREKYGSDLPRLKKKSDELRDAQAEVMKMNADRMNGQMKSMMSTMIIATLVFVWLAVFITVQTPIHLVTTPWGSAWDLQAQGPLFGLFPQWVILYALLSLPLGQFVGATLKIWTFNKRLKADEGGTGKGDGDDPDLPEASAGKADRNASVKRRGRLAASK